MSTAAGWVLVGPTASGKSAVAEVLAEKAGGRGRAAPELWSTDSMAVYRGMDIGTAKPGAAERSRFRYRGLDLAGAGETFSAGAYLEAMREAWREGGGGMPIVVGGTGLYLRALLEGLQAGAGGAPELRAEAEAILEREGPEGLARAARALNPGEFAKIRDPENPRRLVRAYELFKRGEGWPAAQATERPLPVLAGIRRGREDLWRRIERRTRRMYADGLVEETRRLLEAEGGLSETARHAIGYAEAAAVLRGEFGEEEAIARTALRTRQYAKRQMTWFRHQARVEWVDAGEGESEERLAGRVARVWERFGAAALRGVESDK